MSGKTLILSLGTNLGDRELHLKSALSELNNHFRVSEMSRVYESKAVDYLEQPNFLNQVIQANNIDQDPIEVLKIIQKIELDLGRVRNIPKGPRNIDIDILFYGLEIIKTENLEIPHPRLFERSFIVFPLKELSFYDTLKNSFSFNKSLIGDAKPFSIA